MYQQDGLQTQNESYSGTAYQHATNDQKAMGVQGLAISGQQLK